MHVARGLRLATGLPPLPPLQQRNRDASLDRPIAARASKSTCGRMASTSRRRATTCVADEETPRDAKAPAHRFPPTSALEHLTSKVTRGPLFTLQYPVLSTYSVVQAELTCPLSHCRWTDYAEPTSVNLDGGGMTRTNLRRIGKILFGIVCFALSGCQAPMRTEAASAGAGTPSPGSISGSAPRFSADGPDA